MVCDCLDKNDFGNTIMWKKFVKKQVWDLEILQWKLTCSMYDKLNVYNRCVHEMKLHPWWMFVKFYPSFFKMTAAVISVLMGEQPRGFQIYDKKKCEICRNNDIDCSFHVLFECRALDTVRSNLFSKVILSMPDCIKLHFESLVSQEKMRFLLSGFQQTRYVESYAELYKSTAKFVYFLYKTRYELYDATRIGVT